MTTMTMKSKDGDEDGDEEEDEEEDEDGDEYGYEDGDEDEDGRGPHQMIYGGKLKPEKK